MYSLVMKPWLQRHSDVMSAPALGVELFGTSSEQNIHRQKHIVSEKAARVLRVTTRDRQD